MQNYFPTGLAFNMEYNYISDTKVIRVKKKTARKKKYLFFKAKIHPFYIYEEALQWKIKQLLN